MDATEDQLILATGGYDHTIKVWQAHTGNCIKTMRFVETSVSAARRSPPAAANAIWQYNCRLD